MPIFNKVEKYIVEKTNRKINVSLKGYLPIFKEILDYSFNKSQQDFKNIKILEIGSGQHLALPLMLSNVGFNYIYTTDLKNITVNNLLLKIVKELDECEEYKKLINSYGLNPILNVSALLNCKSSKKLLEKANIHYLDELDLTNKSSIHKSFPENIDLIFSLNVLEHIPRDIIISIFRNFEEIFSSSYHIHHIDLEDHKSKIFHDLHPLNFLKYSEFKWNLLARNHYQYLNRLCFEEYKEIFSSIRKTSILIPTSFLDLEKWDPPESFIHTELSHKKYGELRATLIME